MLQSKFPCMYSYSANDVIDVNENRESYVFKKFINAAIYVEKTVKRMAPNYQNYQKHLTESIRVMKTKRCSCSIDADSCSFHPSMASGDGLKSTKSETQMGFQNKSLRDIEEINTSKSEDKNRATSPISNIILQPKQDIVKTPLQVHLQNLEDRISPKYIPSEIELCQKLPSENEELQRQIRAKIQELEKEQLIQEDKTRNKYSDDIKKQDQITTSGSTSNDTTSTTLSSCSQITVKQIDKTFKGDMKLSLSSLTSFTPTENESVRQWLTRKLEERKRKQLALQKEERRKEIERQKILEKERENFKIWLAAKKKKEEKKQAEMQTQRQLDQLRELEKQKRHLENQIKYQIWLKRKEAADMGKKNQEQMKGWQQKVDKEQRVLANQRAFQEWVESSKNKQKPIPFSKGLDSLRSSLSVTYVNPIPWVPPNVEYKPASQ